MSGAPCPWHEPAWIQLQQAQREGRLAPALLLSGPLGVGKRRFARAVAKAGLCEDAQAGACGQCGSCRQFEVGVHPDYLEIAIAPDKREILIDQIRDFTASIQLTAGQGGRGRYGVILAADRMNHAAANALLKTLEEPPQGVRLLLTASQLGRMPATIRSRCSRMALPMPSEEQSRQWLSRLDPPIDPRLVTPARGPCALENLEQPAELLKREQSWGSTITQLRRQRDPMAAAKSVGEGDCDRFVEWWQGQLLGDMKHGDEPVALRRLWDALIQVRAQSHIAFNRLLVLEGLFILYLNLTQDGPRQRGSIAT